MPTTPAALRVLLALAVLALSSTASAGPEAVAPPYDTVYLANGGRARGLVVEDDPAAGVTIQLADGSFRRYARGEVARVEFAARDAGPAASAAVTPSPSAPPPPQAAPPPPPQTAPPPPPQAAPPAPPVYPPPPPQAGPPAPPIYAPPTRVAGPGAPQRFTLSLGLGGAYTAGSVSGHLGSTSRWWPGFTLFQLEVGARITPATTLLLYLDGGAGDVSSRLEALCRAGGYDCVAASARLGLALRRSFTPTLERTTWVSVGTGVESTGITIGGPWGDQHISFGGWEALKLGAGIDFRLGRWIGLGVFSGVSLATFSSVVLDGPTYLDPGPLGGRSLHVWLQLGGRVILFP